MTYRATCEECGNTITDGSRAWLDAAAEAHAKECPEAGPDETAEVAVEDLDADDADDNTEAATA